MSMTDDNPYHPWEKRREPPFNSDDIKWACDAVADVQQRHSREYKAWGCKVLTWAGRELYEERKQVTELREKLDVSIAAHHACLAELAQVRASRDARAAELAEAKERDARLCKELIRADEARDLWRQRAGMLRERLHTYRKRVCAALGLGDNGCLVALEMVVQRAEALVAVDRDAREWTKNAVPGIMRIRKALKLDLACTADAMADAVDKLVAEAEYQRNEQGRLAKQVADLGADMHGLRGKFEYLVEAVRTVYYAARWTPDRPVEDPNVMWARVRNAAGFPKGQSPKPLDDEERTDYMCRAHGDGQESALKDCAKALGVEYTEPASFLAACEAIRAAGTAENVELRAKLDEARRYIGEMACGMPVEGWDRARARELVRAADERTTKAVAARLAADKQLKEVRAVVDPLLDFLFTNTDNLEREPRRGMWIGWRNINDKSGPKLTELAMTAGRALGFY